MQAIPAGLLTIDACVIEDQPGHLVLAIRVPKDTIGANMPFLAALAEYSAQSAETGAGSVFSPKEAPLPKNLKNARTGLIAVAGGIAAFVAVLVAAPGQADSPAPIVYHDAVNETPVVAPDGDLVMRFLVHRRRVCKTDIDRVIMTAGHPGEIVWRARVAGIGVAATKTPVERRIRIVLPEGLPDGSYIYKSTLFSDCGDGVMHSLESPDIRFSVGRDDP